MIAFADTEGRQSITPTHRSLGAGVGWLLNATSRPPYPWGIPGTRCVGGLVGLAAALDGGEKSRFRRDSIPGPSGP
jgi:hypothetical protein